MAAIARIGRIRIKIYGGVGLLLLCIWACGCATLSPGPRRENFAPIFIYSEDEEREGKAIDLLGPFITYRKDREERTAAFRPLYYRKKGPGQYTLLDYLYPLGRYERTDREVESYGMPLYLTRRDLTQKEAEKKERGFLLLFWGETDKGEPYGGFFPIYGNLKRRFGHDEISFFLWTLYSVSRDGESKTYTFLWPILTYSEGGGREGFRIWPLGGYDQKENDYRKRFFLWPFFQFEKRHLYTDDPTDIDIAWPFYVSMENSKRGQKSVLWPFFTYAHDTDEHYTQWDFPWPFFQWAKGDNKSIFRIFPIYGRKHWEEIERGYILWPLYWYVRQDDDRFKEVLDRYLLLSKVQTRQWKLEGKTDRRWRIWPFFYYRQEYEAGAYVYWPCIIPLDYEGFERNWVPVLSLYEYRRDARGASESKFLWGFYLHRQNAVRELYELSFFLTYYKAVDLSYFCVLRGLLEYRAEGSARALRILYSPWPIEWVSSPLPREEIAERNNISRSETIEGGK